jgi:predicted amidohydrolase YtcJ
LRLPFNIAVTDYGLPSYASETVIRPLVGVDLRSPVVNRLQLFPRLSLALLSTLFLTAMLGCGIVTRSNSLGDAGAGTGVVGGEADVVVYTAREIITLDDDHPKVRAIAIENDRILATGSIEEVMRAIDGRSFRVDRQFDDSVLVPGLINQHEHTWLTAIAMIVEIVSIEDWDLPGKMRPRATDEADYRRKVKALVDSHAEAHAGTDEVFYTWGYHQLFHGDLSRSVLDEMSETVPIVVLQRSMHEVLFNTRALDFFGIDQALIDQLPEHARAQTDLARGHFWEQGSFAVVPAFFPNMLAPERYLPALGRARDYWHAAGSTLVAEPGGMVAPSLMAAQNHVLGDPSTPFRLHYIADGKSLAIGRPDDEVIPATEAQVATAKGFTRFLPKQVKLFADGAMFSQLMMMRDGYLDGHKGEWLMQPEEFERAFQIYWDAEYQIHVHQNGDAGLDLVLDVLEANMERNPRSDHRTVIVHFGFSRSDQVERIATLNALVSANPFYTTVLADRYSEVGIGPERAQEMVRLGEAVRAGISISLHADMPMAPGKPLLLMSSAVNRITVGGNLAGPSQRLTAEQALRAVTLDAAYSLRLEKEVGSLKPGKLANLTVLAENPLTVDPLTIGDIRVLGTIHEGRVLPIEAN